MLLGGMAAAAIAYGLLPWGPAANAGFGALIGVGIILLETRIRMVSAKEVAGGFAGALLGVDRGFARQRPIGQDLGLARSSNVLAVARFALVHLCGADARLETG